VSLPQSGLFGTLAKRITMKQKWSIYIHNTVEFKDCRIITNKNARKTSAQFFTMSKSASLSLQELLFCHFFVIT
jgi:hypothetical protein